MEEDKEEKEDEEVYALSSSLLAREALERLPLTCERTKANCLILLCRR